MQCSSLVYCFLGIFLCVQEGRTRVLDMEQQQDATVSTDPQPPAAEPPIPMLEPILLHQLLSNQAILPQLLSNQAILPQLLSNLATFPQLLSNQATFPQLLSNQATLPQLLSNQATFPQLLSNQATLPQLLSNQATFPQLLSNQASLPQLLFNHATRPQLLSHQAAVLHSNQAILAQLLSSQATQPQLLSNLPALSQLVANQAGQPVSRSGHQFRRTVGNNIGQYLLLTGNFELETGATNDWHHVSITKTSGNDLTWSNRAGVSWTMTFSSMTYTTTDTTDTTTTGFTTTTTATVMFSVGPDCPYFSAGYTEGKLYLYQNGRIQIEGPWLELYTKMPA